MSTNIYVGNLSFDTDSSKLEELFAQHGPVTKAQVITDRETGRSRGFGFVEMGSADAAERAISALISCDRPIPEPTRLTTATMSGGSGREATAWAMRTSLPNPTGLAEPTTMST